MGICMKCFQIDLNELPKVALWGKEALIPPRLHYSRYLTEYVMYVVIKGELKLMVFLHFLDKISHLYYYINGYR